MALVETPARLEPCQPTSYPGKLADLISAVTASATALGARLHPLTAASLAELVRVMNCYYSNLIEGHDTRPRDIERALFDQLDEEPERRNLQLEARAHIRVQRVIDERHLSSSTSFAYSPWARLRASPPSQSHITASTTSTLFPTATAGSAGWWPTRWLSNRELARTACGPSRAVSLAGETIVANTSA